MVMIQLVSESGVSNRIVTISERAVTACSKRMLGAVWVRRRL